MRDSAGDSGGAGSLEALLTADGGRAKLVSIGARLALSLPLMSVEGAGVGGNVVVVVGGIFRALLEGGKRRGVCSRAGWDSEVSDCLNRADVATYLLFFLR